MKKVVIFVYSVLCLATTSTTAQTGLNNSISVEDIDHIKSACDLLDAWGKIIEGGIDCVFGVHSLYVEALEMDWGLLQSNEERFKTKANQYLVKIEELKPIFNRIEERMDEMN